MADNPTGLTTEQLLLELGKVVMGLGRKIDFLGEKLDGIHSAISQELIPALSNNVPLPDGMSAAVMDITPLIEKLDELKTAFAGFTPGTVSGESIQTEPLSDKLQAIESVLSDQILPALKEMKAEEASGQMNITPLIEKLDELKTAFAGFTPGTVSGESIQTGPLSDKLQAIESVLSDQILPALKEMKAEEASGQMNVTPLIEKLDELKTAFAGFTPGTVSGESIQTEPLSDKLQAIESVLSDQILPALKEMKAEDTALQIDLNPVIEKLDALAAAIAVSGESNDLKPICEALEQLPSLLADRLKEIGEESTANPMLTVEQKLAEVCEKLEEIRITAGNREFAEELSERISEIRDRLVSSGDEMLVAVRVIPEKVELMHENLSGAINTLSENTGEVLGKAEKSFTESTETLTAIKNELHNGLKLNTEMTTQMVELTSRFADRAMEDRVLDLNTRAIGHFNRGEYTEAGALFSQAIDISPENPELLSNTAHLKAAIGDMAVAEKFFKLALEASPELEPAISGLGMLMVKTGRAEETIEFLKQTVVNGDASIRTVIAYSRALAALERHAEAVELLESSLRGAPDNPDLNEELSLYGNGKLPE